MSKDLNQGDLLGPILAPDPILPDIFGVRISKEQIVPAQAKHLRASPNDLRLMYKVRRLDLAMVLSNSCDNAQGRSALFVAPVVPFVFPPKAQGNPETEWSAINGLATGTSNTKAFYLAGSPEFALPRSQVSFPQMFTMTHESVDRLAKEYGTKRVCGLTPEAIRHLQWVFNSFISRNPREDFDWPSDEDLALKKAALEAQRQKPGANVHEIDLTLEKLDSFRKGSVVPTEHPISETPAINAQQLKTSMDAPTGQAIAGDPPTA